MRWARLKETLRQCVCAAREIWGPETPAEVLGNSAHTLFIHAMRIDLVASLPKKVDEKLVEEWQKAVATYKHIDQYNEALNNVGTLPADVWARVRAVMVASANQLGFRWDATKNLFVETL